MVAHSGAAGAVLALLVGLAAWAEPARACTFFAVKGERGVWVGNNEDFNYPRSRVWFLPAEPGRHGRVIFGFESGEALGGMNDQGLFFDWVATGPTGWLPDPGKPPAPGQLGELALETASTVEEAIALFRRYNESQLAFSHPVLADRTGDSAVLGWEDGRLTVARSPGRIQAFGFGEARARPLLDRLATASPDSLAPVLRAALQDGEFATKYSNLYDLERRRVYWYDLHRGAGPFAFDLAEELAKGSHFYELLELPGQLAHPSRSDQRTLPAVRPTEAALTEIAGRYQLGDVLLDLALEDGQLILEISAAPFRRFELVPVAPDRVVARHEDADLRFEREADGRIAAAVLTYVSIGSAERPFPDPQSTFRFRRVPAAAGRGLFDLGPVELGMRSAERIASIRSLLPGYSDQVGIRAELDAAPSGPGYTVYHGGAGGQVDVETVQPVVTLAPDAGRVRFRTEGPVQVVSVTHHGPHSTLRMAYGALAGWAREHGWSAAGPSRETYLRGAWNEANPRAWETLVEIPVVQRSPPAAEQGSEKP